MTTEKIKLENLECGSDLGGTKFLENFILKIQSFCSSEEEVYNLLNSKEDLIHFIKENDFSIREFKGCHCVIDVVEKYFDDFINLSRNWTN